MYYKFICAIYVSSKINLHVSFYVYLISNLFMNLSYSLLQETWDFLQYKCQIQIITNNYST